MKNHQSLGEGDASQLYRRILVTGGSSTIGSALKEISGSYADREFYFPSSRQCNLTREDQLSELVKSLKPDALIHTAAISGGIQLSINHPATLLRDNTLMALNVLEVARRTGVKKVVQTLSTGMYPANAPNPLKEECIHDGVPHSSNYGYSFAKRLMDPLARAYRSEFNLNVISLIPNAILSGRSSFNPDSSTMVPSLIRRFYEARMGTSDLTVWGDGTPLREVTWAGDIARAYMWCLDNYDEPQPLNVGTTEEASVKDFAYMIAEMLGIDNMRIVFDATKPSGQQRKNTDNSRFVRLSGFKYTPICEAVRKTVEYFVANYPDPSRLRL